jgi:hypothetical protein
MSDPTDENDIDVLLRYLDGGASPWWADSVRALVAERNALREQLRLCSINAVADAGLPALITQRDALKARVAELEKQLKFRNETYEELRWRLIEKSSAQPPAASDMRERLVRAIWPELLRIHTEYAKDPRVHGDPREQARRFALIEADEMIAAMRKEEADA